LSPSKMSDQYDFLPPLSEFNVLHGSDEDLFQLDSEVIGSSGQKVLFEAPSQELPTFPEPMQIEFPHGAIPTFDFATVKTEKSETPKAKKQSERKITRKAESKHERQEQRKIKHRLIDRRRRLREKHSIDDLKDLVSIHPSEKPDKANIVAGAVRTIKDLQQQIAELEAKLARATLEDSPGKTEENVPLTTMIEALTGSGMTAIVLSFDCTVKEVNPILEAATGFDRKQLINTKFGDAPLFGRLVHGEFPRDRFVKPSDSKQAQIVTSSSDDYTSSDLHQAFEVVMSGGSWKVVTRYVHRDGTLLVESFATLMPIPGAVLCISSPENRRFVPLPQRPRRPVAAATPAISSAQGCQAQFTGYGLIPHNFPQSLKVE